MTGTQPHSNLQEDRKTSDTITTRTTEQEQQQQQGEPPLATTNNDNTESAELEDDADIQPPRTTQNNDYAALTPTPTTATTPQPSATPFSVMKAAAAAAAARVATVGFARSFATTAPRISAPSVARAKGNSGATSSFIKANTSNTPMMRVGQSGLKASAAKAALSVSTAPITNAKATANFQNAAKRPAPTPASAIDPTTTKATKVATPPPLPQSPQLLANTTPPPTATGTRPRPAAPSVLPTGLPPTDTAPNAVLPSGQPPALSPSVPVKRSRGRPRKVGPPPPKPGSRPRGRPRKDPNAPPKERQESPPSSPTMTRNAFKQANGIPVASVSYAPKRGRSSSARYQAQLSNIKKAGEALAKKRAEAALAKSRAKKEEELAVKTNFPAPPKWLTDPTYTEEDAERKVSHKTLRQKLIDRDDGYNIWESHWRKRVKEELAKAYPLHKAAMVLKDIIENDERVQSNDLLKAPLEAQCQHFIKQKADILDIPIELLTKWELNFYKYILYQIEHDEKDCTGVNIPDDGLSKWVATQRRRITDYKNGNKEFKGRQLEGVQQDIRLLSQLNIKLNNKPNTRSFESYYEELKEFTIKNGHARVRRLQDGTNLGEWIHRIRAEYAQFQEGKKVPNLTAERIERLNEIGMVWKIRYGRPKKGDERFRLKRRKSTGDKTNDNNDGSNAKKTKKLRKSEGAQPNTGGAMNVAAASTTTTMMTATATTTTSPAAKAVPVAPSVPPPTSKAIATGVETAPKPPPLTAAAIKPAAGNTKDVVAKAPMPVATNPAPVAKPAASDTATPVHTPAKTTTATASIGLAPVSTTTKVSADSVPAAAAASTTSTAPTANLPTAAAALVQAPKAPPTTAKPVETSNPSTVDVPMPTQTIRKNPPVPANSAAVVSTPEPATNTTSNDKP